jgi:hypothetical protein
MSDSSGTPRDRDAMTEHDATMLVENFAQAVRDSLDASYEYGVDSAKHSAAKFDMKRIQTTLIIALVCAGSPDDR